MSICVSGAKLYSLFQLVLLGFKELEMVQGTQGMCPQFVQYLSDPRTHGNTHNSAAPSSVLLIVYTHLHTFPSCTPLLPSIFPYTYLLPPTQCVHTPPSYDLHTPRSSLFIFYGDFDLCFSVTVQRHI